MLCQFNKRPSLGGMDLKLKSGVDPKKRRRECSPDPRRCLAAVPVVHARAANLRSDADSHDDWVAVRTDDVASHLLQRDGTSAGTIDGFPLVPPHSSVPLQASLCRATTAALVQGDVDVLGRYTAEQGQQ